MNPVREPVSGRAERVTRPAWRPLQVTRAKREIEFHFPFLKIRIHFRDEQRIIMDFLKRSETMRKSYSLLVLLLCFVLPILGYSEEAPKDLSGKEGGEVHGC